MVILCKDCVGEIRIVCCQHDMTLMCDACGYKRGLYYDYLEAVVFHNKDHHTVTFDFNTCRFEPTVHRKRSDEKL